VVRGASHVPDLQPAALGRFGDHPSELASAADGLAIHRHDDVVLGQPRLRCCRIGGDLGHQGAGDASKTGGLGLLGRQVTRPHADARPAAQHRHVRHILERIVHDHFDVEIANHFLGGAGGLLDRLSDGDEGVGAGRSCGLAVHDRAGEEHAGGDQRQCRRAGKPESGVHLFILLAMRGHVGYMRREGSPEG